MSNQNLREEEIKNNLAQNYFTDFSCTKIIGNIDFCVSLKLQISNQIKIETESLLWAEAKKGKADFITSLVQLILTIGKARTFDIYLPPAYLGAFDEEKIAFVSYNEIHDIFYMNDFNWNVAPSNYDTKEFRQVYEKVKNIIEENSLVFFFGKDDKELKEFTKTNFVLGKSSTSKVQIDKNNFIVIYTKWLTTVKPTIAVNWDIAKKAGIIDGDFYLADLLSAENETLKQSLSVLLKKDHYQLERRMDEMGLFQSATTVFMDKQVAHHQFWNKYERPPKKDYWDYIVERRDLLVPQDIRERKGSFFTPQIWVELSQKYLADVLGEDWQDEYYLWDCAAGTGNLLTGLTNKLNIWASTLDKQDVDVIQDRINNGANLVENHVFQFDFLNDSFDKLPKELFDIINDSEKRKKLVIYINPPYVEGDSRIGKGRKDTQKTKIHQKYQEDLGKASGELFAQFFMRICKEIPDCRLAEFSTLKLMSAPNFKTFRANFKAKLEKSFIVPADTFDNVKGQFPIGFMIWNISKQEVFKKCKMDIYDALGNYSGQKKIYSYDDAKFISTLIQKSKIKHANELEIGHMSSIGNDFQHQNALFIDDLERPRIAGGRHTTITNTNLINVVVYFAVRKVIPATWLNDRDQFLNPKDKWKKDTEFQNDCFAYTLFNTTIQSEYGKNNWIPFTEYEVEAKERFDSNFMTDFISGKIKKENGNSLFVEKDKNKRVRLEFSKEAKTVFDAGLELWKYYHHKINTKQYFLGAKPNHNASLYDIRAYFQGRNANGKMNNKSEDTIYMELIGNLRNSLKVLAKKIEPKIYEYEFLKG